MISRAYRVFLRYCEGRISLTGKGGESQPKDGNQTVTVETVTLDDDRLRIVGCSDFPHVKVTAAQIVAMADVDGSGRFSVELPGVSGPVTVLAQGDDVSASATIAGVSTAALRRARVSQFVPFCVALLVGLPEIWRWKRRGDMGARNRIKERLGLTPPSRAVELDAAVLCTPTDRAATRDPVTIILPVFNALELLTETLARIARNTGIPWRLVLIDDGSTDPLVRPMLQEWAGQAGRKQNVTLLVNDHNLGFIGTVNRALKVAQAWPDAPVILLNSDAWVPANWASRIIAPLLADPTVASVTPMSNDAEIFTVPAICQRHDLFAGEADKIDTVAAQLGQNSVQISAPTGVGFCMALSPQFLAKLPQLDTAFGRGYGEETDWCQKAATLGGRHVAAANLFVEHCGGASFGSAAKLKLLARNGAIISKRYPQYDDQVTAFIRSDPLVTTRLALGLAWAAARQDGAVPIYIAHAMGGGAENYLQDRLQDDLANTSAAVILRVGQGHRWQIELHAALGDGRIVETSGLTQDDDVIRKLIQILPEKRIVYSCGVGADDAYSLPDMMRGFAGAQDIVEVLFHDFFPVSPSYTLIGAQGIYQGVPTPDADVANDSVHRYRRQGGPLVSLADWQKAWGELLKRADSCVVFSDSSAAIVTQVYPEVADKILIRPHSRDLPDLTSDTAAPDAPLVIGVLGNIGAHKGAAVVAQISRDLARSGRGKVVMIGRLDEGFSLAPPSFVHGQYAVEDLPKLVRRYGITGWFMPSIWPETYSFVVHEILATGLPVTCFDLGAQADAVRAAGGRVLPLGDGPVLVDDVVAALAGTAG